MTTIYSYDKVNNNNKITFVELIEEIAQFCLTSRNNGKSLEKEINSHFKTYNNYLIHKEDGSYCTNVVFEPNGSQLGPDWEFVFNNGVTEKVELKTSKKCGLHLNEGVPDNIIIFVQHKKDVNFSSCIILLEDYEPNLRKTKLLWDQNKSAVMKYANSLLNSSNIISTLRIKWKANNLANINKDTTFYKNLKQTSLNNFKSRYK